MKFLGSDSGLASVAASRIERHANRAADRRDFAKTATLTANRSNATKISALALNNSARGVIRYSSVLLTWPLLSAGAVSSTRRIGTSPVVNSDRYEPEISENCINAVPVLSTEIESAETPSSFATLAIVASSTWHEHSSGPRFTNSAPRRDANSDPVAAFKAQNGEHEGCGDCNRDHC
jgi:hypothetical protein